MNSGMPTNFFSTTQALWENEQRYLSGNSFWNMIDILEKKKTFWKNFCMHIINDRVVV